MTNRDVKKTPHVWSRDPRRLDRHVCTQCGASRIFPFDIKKPARLYDANGKSMRSNARCPGVRP